ncbi:uncharacterized protein K02A2.6-like [Camellia sinensis]|uniref:uncharacterized protein K02A2.6-like n=1 Tax=Camellia sinensis TaxID=4442 RepID=UPI001036CC17|nr:uncharacterized protein K02A2.6-like [Camellia sinensis]
MARWLLALAEYDITCVTPKAIKSQALVDLLAQFPSGEHEPVEVSLPGKVHVSTAAVETYWDLKFDGACGAGKGLIAQQSKGYRWILAATEVSTKWVETIPIRKVDGAGVANFIRENIICMFGIPKVTSSDNGTPFVNRHMGRLLDAYQIKHHKSSLYYPQGNGQAEATSKTLIRILSKMMDEVEVELAVPSAKMAMSVHLVPDSRNNYIEAAEEKKDRTSQAMEKYHQSIARAYNQSVQHRKFKERDLVWKTVDAIMRGQPIPKFSPRWEGPYKVAKANSSRYYKLTKVDDGFKIGHVNAKYVKEYFP